jgi:hypothetical protein
MPHKQECNMCFDFHSWFVQQEIINNHTHISIGANKKKELIFR